MKQEKINNYFEICLYNKELEIIKKINEGRADESEKDRFSNIFRTEAKFKNGKLNIDKCKRKN